MKYVVFFILLSFQNNRRENIKKLTTFVNDPLNQLFLCLVSREGSMPGWDHMSVGCGDKQLTILDSWLCANRLSLNIQKTSFMVIFNMELQRFPLKIRNCELSRVQKAKFLGVIVDEKLNFKDHVNCIQKRYPDPLELFIESRTIFRLVYS